MFRKCNSSFLISNFRRVLNVVCFLLGDSSGSEFYMPTFRNTLSHLHSTRTYLPMKMEQCSETSAYKIQTPGNHPKESIQHNSSFFKAAHSKLFIINVLLGSVRSTTLSINSSSCVTLQVTAFWLIQSPLFKYIYIYIYIYTHTYIHTHTHTHSCSLRRVLNELCGLPLDWSWPALLYTIV